MAASSSPRLSDIGKIIIVDICADMEQEEERDFIISQAALGDPTYQFFYGRYLYEKGEYDEAKVWIQKAVDQNHGPALCLLGKMYKMGQGVEINFLTGLQYLVKSAQEAQWPLAQYHLGRLYEEGYISDKPNITEAKKWYELAKKYHPPTYSRLQDLNLIASQLLSEGKDVDNNDAWIEYFRNLLNKPENPIANLHLGIARLKGLLNEKQDLGAAIKFLEKAVEKGNMDACYYLAEVLDDLDIIEEKKIALLKLAANNNKPKALFLLAILEMDQDHHKEAFSYFLKAAELGHPFAQSRIAELYLDLDNVEAFKWAEKAAIQGIPDAQFVLSQADKKNKWLECAALNGHIIAQNFFGLQFLSDYDYEKALLWFTTSAAQGDAKGQFNLGMTYRTLSLIHRHCATDYNNKAKMYLLQSAQQRFAPAAYALGCYYRDIDDKKNALIFFQKAYLLFQKDRETYQREIAETFVCIKVLAEELSTERGKEQATEREEKRSTILQRLKEVGKLKETSRVNSAKPLTAIEEKAKKKKAKQDRYNERKSQEAEARKAKEMEGKKQVNTKNSPAGHSAENLPALLLPERKRETIVVAADAASTATSPVSLSSTYRIKRSAVSDVNKEDKNKNKNILYKKKEVLYQKYCELFHSHIPIPPAIDEKINNFCLEVTKPLCDKELQVNIGLCDKYLNKLRDVANEYKEKAEKEARLGIKKRETEDKIEKEEKRGGAEEKREEKKEKQERKEEKREAKKEKRGEKDEKRKGTEEKQDEQKEEKEIKITPLQLQKILNSYEKTKQLLDSYQRMKFEADAFFTEHKDSEERQTRFRDGLGQLLAYMIETHKEEHHLLTNDTAIPTKHFLFDPKLANPVRNWLYHDKGMSTPDIKEEGRSTRIDLAKLLKTNKKLWDMTQKIFEFIQQEYKLLAEGTPSSQESVKARFEKLPSSLLKRIFQQESYDESESDCLTRCTRLPWEMDAYNNNGTKNDIWTGFAKEFNSARHSAALAQLARITDVPPMTPYAHGVIKGGISFRHASVSGNFSLVGRFSTRSAKSLLIDSSTNQEKPGSSSLIAKLKR